MVEAFDLRGLTGPADAKRANAELHPRLDLFHVVVNLFDQTVDVIPPPIIAIEFRTRGLGFFPTGVVGKWQNLAIFRNGIRIKIVVHVNTVDVVPLDNVADHGHRVLERLGFPRIHPVVIAVLLDDFRVGLADMRIRRGGRLSRVPCAVGVEPDMEFQPSLVGLFNRERQRIVIRIGGFAHFAGQKFRPGFELRFVKCITAWPDLQDDRVEIHPRGGVEQGDHFCLLLGGAQPRLRWPIDIGDRRDPCRAEFAPQGRSLVGVFLRFAPAQTATQDEWQQDRYPHKPRRPVRQLSNNDITHLRLPPTNWSLSNDLPTIA